MLFRAESDSGARDKADHGTNKAEDAPSSRLTDQWMLPRLLLWRGETLVDSTLLLVALDIQA